MATCSEEGVLRLARTALSVNGGFDVTLRMPGAAVSGSDAEQMGLATPQFEDTPMGPAVWRRAGSAKSLLIAADPVVQMAGGQDTASALALFQGAVGLVVDGVLYSVVKCDAVLTAGIAGAYLLELQAPAWA